MCLCAPVIKVASVRLNEDNRKCRTPPTGGTLLCFILFICLILRIVYIIRQKETAGYFQKLGSSMS